MIKPVFLVNYACIWACKKPAWVARKLHIQFQVICNFCLQPNCFYNWKSSTPAAKQEIEAEKRSRPVKAVRGVMGTAKRQMARSDSAMLQMKTFVLLHISGFLHVTPHVTFTNIMCRWHCDCGPYSSQNMICIIIYVRDSHKYLGGTMTVAFCIIYVTL